MHVLLTFCLIGAILAGSPVVSSADPIQKIKGVITEVGEGFLWLTPEDQSAPLKFILRWTARFVPPKLPLKGDHVSILYKVKEEGLVIYGLVYSKIASESGKTSIDSEIGESNE
ncbi:MAG: hypothetical protein WCJ75_03635 [Desulfomonile sp.]